MLDKLIPESPLLTVQEHGRLHVTGDPSNSLTGQVRFNVNNQKLETYTGHSWVSISWDHSLNLGSDVQELIRWAKNKMQQDKKLEAKLAKYPGLRQAHDQFKMLEALAHEEDKLEP